MKLIIKCGICNVQGLELVKEDIEQELIDEMKACWGCECGAASDTNQTDVTDE